MPGRKQRGARTLFLDVDSDTSPATNEAWIGPAISDFPYELPSLDVPLGDIGDSQRRLLTPQLRYFPVGSLDIPTLDNPNARSAHAARYAHPGHKRGRPAPLQYGGSRLDYLPRTQPAAVVSNPLPRLAVPEINPDYVARDGTSLRGPYRGSSTDINHTRCIWLNDSNSAQCAAADSSSSRVSLPIPTMIRVGDEGDLGLGVRLSADAPGAEAFPIMDAEWRLTDSHLWIWNIATV